MSVDLRLRIQRALRDQYVLDDELGRGGMAVVYRARNTDSNEAVAIKFLLPAVADVVGKARFIREIELGGTLVHPHILRIQSTGDADGLPYYVMALVSGASLRQRLMRGAPIAVAECVRIASEVADALGYAHAQAVVHRDIKPENILFDGESVVVTDFGVGKALDVAGGSSLTATGFIVGTPAYMSPEQAAGDPDLDGRSDLYSLGTMMYEMLAGGPPFTGQTAQQIIASRFTRPPRPLQEIRPDLPPALTGSVHRLLALRPGERFADAAELVESLRGVTQGAA